MLFDNVNKICIPKKRRLASYRESMDQPPASTPVQDIVSSVPEDPSDEIIDVQNADPVSSELGLYKLSKKTFPTLGLYIFKG
jgi:hypothetical protein